MTKRVLKKCWKKFGHAMADVGEGAVTKNGPEFTWRQLDRFNGFLSSAVKRWNREKRKRRKEFQFKK